MTWPSIEHERRRYEADAPYETAQEATLMQRGWLLKVRFTNQPQPNVSWFWIPTGNCTACYFYQPGDRDRQPKCANPDVAISSKFFEYLNGSDCPGYQAGISLTAAFTGARESDMADAMQAAGLADGQPTQPTEIVQKLQWTPWRSHQAHAQQGEFLAQARAADAGTEPMQVGDVGPIEV